MSDFNRRDFLWLAAAAVLSGCGFFIDTTRKKPGLVSDENFFPRQTPPLREVDEKQLISSLKSFVYANYNLSLFGRTEGVIESKRELELILRDSQLGTLIIDQLAAGEVPDKLVEYFEKRKKVFRKGPQTQDLRFDFELRGLKTEEKKEQVLWGKRKEYVLRVFDADYILNAFDYRLHVEGKGLGRIGGMARSDAVECYLDAMKVVLSYFFKTFQENKKELEKEIENPRLLDRYVGEKTVDPFFYQRLGEILHYQRFQHEINTSSSLDEFIGRVLLLEQRNIEVHECQHLIDGLPAHCKLDVTKMHGELRAFLTEMQHSDARKPLATAFGLMAAASVGDLIPEYYHKMAAYLVRFVCQVISKSENRSKLSNVDYSAFDKTQNILYLMEQIPQLRDNQIQGTSKAIFKAVYRGMDFDTYMKGLSVERNR